VKASVVICTYNRAASLRRTLETLERQSNQGLEDVEVLVVDNNCEDDTQAVVRSFAERLPIRCCREPEQGLSYARNRGVRDSLGDTVIFTDDDVSLDERWVASFLRAFEVFPESGYFGGRIRPDWTAVARPAWVHDERMPLLSGVFGCYDRGEINRRYGDGEETPFGASFAVRRSVFAAHGVFRGDLGVKGADRGRGEDTEFLGRIRAAGVVGVYVGEALCWHRVDPERLTLVRFFRHGIAKGQSEEAISGRVASGSYAMAVSFIVRGLRQSLLGRGDRLRQCVINAGMEVGKRRAAGAKSVMVAHHADR